jgi:hypothetical protein
MGTLKTRSMTLVLLLALILPLQSFASIGCGSADAPSFASQQHCADHPGEPQSGAAPQHHHCGSCCVTAIAAAPLRFTPPPLTNPGVSLPAHRPLLSVTLDRLDRPPRLV